MRVKARWRRPVKLHVTIWRVCDKKNNNRWRLYAWIFSSQWSQIYPYQRLGAQMTKGLFTRPISLYFLNRFRNVGRLSTMWVDYRQMLSQTGSLQTISHIQGTQCLPGILLSRQALDMFQSFCWLNNHFRVSCYPNTQCNIYSSYNLNTQCNIYSSCHINTQCNHYSSCYPNIQCVAE